MAQRLRTGRAARKKIPLRKSLEESMTPATAEKMLKALGRERTVLFVSRAGRLFSKSLVRKYGIGSIKKLMDAVGAEKAVELMQNAPMPAVFEDVALVKRMVGERRSVEEIARSLGAAESGKMLKRHR